MANTPQEKVYDRWYPWRLGCVVKRTKTSLTVRWSDGETWRYDKAHQRFLTPGETERGR